MVSPENAVSVMGAKSGVLRLLQKAARFGGRMTPGLLEMT
jgi:hypothetical protein